MPSLLQWEEWVCPTLFSIEASPVSLLPPPLLIPSVLPSPSLLLHALSLSAPPWHPLSLTSSHFSVCISYYLLLLCLLPQLIKWYHRTGFICIWLRGFSAVGCMFIKWLCVEGCNEPILLQSSSLPILGGDYVFIRKKENRKAQLLEHGVWGWVRRRESGSDSGKGLSSVRSGGREG